MSKMNQTTESTKTSSAPSCISCTYWKGDRSSPSFLGYCRRKPPVLKLTCSASDYNRENVYESMFPEAYAHQWCGEWKLNIYTHHTIETNPYEINYVYEGAGSLGV